MKKLQNFKQWSGCKALWSISWLLFGVGTWVGCSTTQTMDAEHLMAYRSESSQKRREIREAYRQQATEKDADALPRLSGALSLTDAITVGLANNRTLKTVYLTRTEAEGLVTQATAGAYPQVGLSASASLEEAKNDSTDSMALGVEVTQPFWRSGAVREGVRYAKLYVASTDFTIRENVQSVVGQIVTSYLNVLLEQHLVKVYEDAAAVSERVLQTAKSRRAQGVVSDYEVLRAEVEVANTRAELINERNALRRAKVAFFQVSGVSQESEVEFQGELIFAPEAYDLEATSEKAFAMRPDLARANTALFMAQTKVDVVCSEYGPKGDLFATGDYSNRIEDEWNDTWVVGARASLKLFDGFERRGKMQVAQSQVDQARETLKDMEARAHVEVVNALMQLKYADELYQSQIKNRDLAREALRIIEVGSSRGRNTQVEVLDARAALTKAMGMYYKAIYTHSLARLDILKVTGTLEPGDTVNALVGAVEQE